MSVRTHSVNILDLVAGIAGTIVGVGFVLLIPDQVYRQEEAFGIGTRFFPTVSGVFLTATSLVLVGRALAGLDRVDDSDQPASQPDPSTNWNLRAFRTVAPFVAVLLGYVAALGILGFVVSSVCALAMLLTLTRGRFDLAGAAVTILSVAAIYLFFSRAMHVPLPTGLFSLVGVPGDFKVPAS